MNGLEEKLQTEKSTVTIWLNVRMFMTNFSTNCLQISLWKHSLISLPRGPYTLKDTSFLHGVELLDGIVLLVEVSVGLFPGLCYCVLSRRVRLIHKSFIWFRTNRLIIQVKALWQVLCIFFHHWTGFRVMSSFHHLEGDGCDERQAESNGQVKS